MAVAATDENSTNLEVAREARAKRIAVNVVDGPGQLRFHRTCCFSRGDVTIAVSTNGRSPAWPGKSAPDWNRISG